MRLVRRSRDGFTLYEMLIVMGIVLFLASLLVTVGAWAKNRSLGELTRSELSMMEMATQRFGLDHRAYPKDGIENLVAALKSAGYFPFRQDRLKKVTIQGSGSGSGKELDYTKLNLLVSQTEADIRREKDRLSASLWASSLTKLYTGGTVDTWWPLWDDVNNRWVMYDARYDPALAYNPNLSTAGGAFYWDSASQKAVPMAGTAKLKSLWTSIGGPNTGDMLGYDNTNNRFVVWDSSAAKLYYWDTATNAKAQVAGVTAFPAAGYSAFKELSTETSYLTGAGFSGSGNLSWKVEGEIMRQRIVEQDRRLALLAGNTVNFQYDPGSVAITGSPVGNLPGDTLTRTPYASQPAATDLAAIQRAEQLSKQYWDYNSDSNAVNTDIGNVQAKIATLEASLGSGSNPYDIYNFNGRDSAIAAVSDKFGLFENNWQYDTADSDARRALIAEDANLYDGNTTDGAIQAEIDAVNAYKTARQNAAAATGYDLSRSASDRLADAQARAEETIDALAKGIYNHRDAFDAILYENMMYHIQNNLAQSTAVDSASGQVYKDEFNASILQNYVGTQGGDKNLDGALGRDQDVYPIDNVLSKNGMSMYTTNASSTTTDTNIRDENRMSKIDDFLKGYSKVVKDTFEEFRTSYNVTDEQIRQFAFGCANWVIRVVYRNSDTAIRSLEDELEYWLSEVDHATYEINAAAHNNYVNGYTIKDARYQRPDGNRTSLFDLNYATQGQPPATTNLLAYPGETLTAYTYYRANNGYGIDVPITASSATPPSKLNYNNGTIYNLDTATAADPVKGVRYTNGSNSIWVNWGTDPFNQGPLYYQRNTTSPYINHVAGQTQVGTWNQQQFYGTTNTEYADVTAPTLRAFDPESQYDTQGLEGPSLVYNGSTPSQLMKLVYPNAPVDWATATDVIPPTTYLTSSNDPRLQYLGITSGGPSGTSTSPSNYATLEQQIRDALANNNYAVIDSLYNTAQANNDLQALYDIKDILQKIYGELAKEKRESSYQYGNVTGEYAPVSDKGSVGTPTMPSSSFDWNQLYKSVANAALEGEQYLDPWGNPYIYVEQKETPDTGFPNQGSFFIYSMGPDGVDQKGIAGDDVSLGVVTIGTN